MYIIFAVFFVLSLYGLYKLLIFLIKKLHEFFNYLYRIYQKNKYFNSQEFLNRKQDLAKFIQEHNELVEYIKEIKSKKTFEFGSSSTSQYSHLATSVNTSFYNYQRDRNEITVALNVHNCSLQVVRNASQEPIKYLIKYFGFTPNENTLEKIEKIGEAISQIEEAIKNLSKREIELTHNMKPPKIIYEYYMDEFISHMGMTISEISVPYPTYMFEYISAGGNSSQQTLIELDSPTIDAIIHTISERIKFRKSIAGQRALMTSSLRNEIKNRDNFTCKSCGISIYDEPHLLLEIDHIIPISKGGMTEYENLQTLCWKCNRSKSNKILS